MTTPQIKNRGFTLVELLIVIVIIAILTVISLVAYNGIQNQARTSTSQGVVKNIADKVQIYNTEEGHYPATLSALSGNGDRNEAWHLDANAYVVDGSAAPTNAPTGNDGPKTVSFRACGTAGQETGVTIWGWDFSNGRAIERVVGVC